MLPRELGEGQRLEEPRSSAASCLTPMARSRVARNLPAKVARELLLVDRLTEFVRAGARHVVLLPWREPDARVVVDP